MDEIQDHEHEHEHENEHKKEHENEHKHDCHKHDQEQEQEQCTEEEDHTLNIIIYPYTDPIHDSPALNFPVVKRTMDEGKVLKFGRIVNKDNQESNYFITFQSKVVSRNHAEIWYKDGQLYFRDIGSSSGTFLNKLRLSPSGKESRPYPLRSGDVIQLGIDYHGKKEDIYRCIMMKIIIQGKEANVRRKANIERLNKAIKELIAAASPNTKDIDQLSSVECCICLNTLAPYQALFLAPCTHCFHYKCVHPLLGNGIMFLCPLCRQVANLEATVSTENLFEMGEDLALKSKISSNPAIDNEHFKGKNNLTNNKSKINRNSLNGINGSSTSKEKRKNSKTTASKDQDIKNKSSSTPTSPKKLTNNVTEDKGSGGSRSGGNGGGESSKNKADNKTNHDKKAISNNSLNKNKTTQQQNGPEIITEEISSKKKDLSSPSPSKKVSRKGTLRSLITTTFRRKRSNSTHVSSGVTKNKSKNKNIKSTGNIVNDESKSPNGSLDNIKNVDYSGIVAPITDDDPITAIPISPLPNGKINSEIFSSTSRDDKLAQ